MHPRKLSSPPRPLGRLSSTLLALGFVAAAAAAEPLALTAQRITAAPEVITAANSVDDDLVCDGAGGNACVVFRCGGNCIHSLLDNSSKFLTFPITSEALASQGVQNCTLVDVNAAVDLSHGDVGDLSIELSKGGTERTLYDPASGCDATAFDGVFTDESATAPNSCPFAGVSLRPDDSLAAFDGIDPVGNWTFEIRDSESGDEGVLIDLGLAFRVSCQAVGISCTGDADTLCLNNGRFRVAATFETNTGLAGPASAVKLTEDTGYFWFFNSANVETVVKVLNGCGVNDRYWFFAGGLTNVRTVLTVTDTKTGQVKTYTNPQNTAFLPIQDTSAFATCP
jgi:subtilisin-like proprotein convertase family protein